ncbi:MAG TPA: hypothetical protein VNU97_05905 [Rhizomicrobium sp.]|jgi:hypothetical protein|nr:hypothetical protein [Rhizomicrobium sp.]
MRIVSWPPALLVTGLPPDECTRRLKANVQWGFMPFSQTEVVGMVGARWFRLRRNIWYRNSLQAIAAGRLEESGVGTRIPCAFRMNLFAQVFMAIWFLGAISSVMALTSNAPSDAFFSLGFVGFGIGVVAFCRWLARGERDFLIGFLRDTLDAEIEA